MDILGPPGLLLTLGAMCLALALLSILRWRDA
jgi:hypothetical protein